MKVQLHYFAAKILILIAGVLLVPLGASAQFTDQHSVEALVAALKSPISPSAVKEARDFDDKLMSDGKIEGGKVYLVTDERSNRVNSLVKKLLESMGEDTQHWVVRVLDTDPPTANAFVTGGKYIYVFTGLVNEAASDDELAFVLSHELGHSLLKHKERKKEDVSTSIAGIAVLAAMVSKKHSADYTDFAKITATSYGRVDEEEADAIAVTITRRAGYDALRGADFFSRGQRQQDKAKQDEQQLLEKTEQEFLQARATCQQWTQQYNSSWKYQTKENAGKVNAICGDAENKRVGYNQLVQQHNTAGSAQQREIIFSTHPQNQNRIAAIAALTDFTYQRRDLQSLTRFQQSYRVMLALQQVDSVLLKLPVQAPTAATPAAATPSRTPAAAGLAERLTQLKRTRDQGLITEAEYESKRQQILNSY